MHAGKGSVAMGIYVSLTILPEHIGATGWKKSYEETLSFLQGCPMQIMGLHSERIGSGDRLVQTRALEIDGDTPDQRHWHAVGDFESRMTGESFTFYRNINRYRFGSPREKHHAGETADIVKNLMEKEKGTRRVFSEKTQGHPYHLPMLAVAMLVEDRFPRYAAAGGDIDIRQARNAQMLIKTVLGRDVAIPIVTDARRLYKRVSLFCRGSKAMERSLYLFRGDESAGLQAILDTTDRGGLEEWFLGSLRQYDSPNRLGTIDLLIQWLNATQDLPALCHMACSDKRGPGFNPVEFASALAFTWLSVPENERDSIAILLKPEGAAYTVDDQFGTVFMDAAGMKGRLLRYFLKPEKALEILARSFPAHAGLIRRAFRQRTAQIRADLAQLRRPLQEYAGKAGADSDPETGDGSSLLRLTSIENASRTQMLMLQAVAVVVRRGREFLQRRAAGLFNGSAARLRDKVLRGAEQQQLVLTEDAWRWIDAETDKELLGLLLCLLSLKEREQTLCNVRKAVFESRLLARGVLKMTHDDALPAKFKKMPLNRAKPAMGRVG